MTTKRPSKGAKQAATSRAVIDDVQVATPCKIPLNSLEDVRREMARVYRDSRTGKMDVTDGGKLSYQLQGIAKLIEATVIEKRLIALENGTGTAQDEAQDVEYKDI